jgi:hypothetical protein
MEASYEGGQCPEGTVAPMYGMEYIYIYIYIYIYCVCLCIYNFYALFRENIYDFLIKNKEVERIKIQ